MVKSVKVRTEALKATYFSYTIYEWNKLREEMRQLDYNGKIKEDNLVLWGLVEILYLIHFM